MKSLLAALVGAFFVALPAAADGPVLVGLFASKNCKACPKAHKTLSAVEAAQSNVMILTWSVDYWDYLGSKDSMALKDSKARQTAYVDRFKLRGPYTPQTVYNGVTQCAGNKPDQVDAHLAKNQSGARTGVTISEKSGRVIVDGKTSDLAEILLVTFLDGDANKTGMVNPVTGMKNIGPWLGGRAEFDRTECKSTCAVIVQSSGNGPVLASYRIN